MSKDLEKQIEEYALSNSGLKVEFDRQEEEYYQREKVQIYDMLKEAIKSDTSKHYWQQGMYSEEDMLNFSFWLLNNIGETSNDRVAHFEDKHYLNKWLERNKKK